MDNFELEKFGFTKKREFSNLLKQLNINVDEYLELSQNDFTNKVDVKVNTRDGKLYNIQLKKMYDLRYNNLLPSMLESFLDSEQFQGQFLLMIRTKKMSKQIIERVRSFLANYNAERLNWIVIDEFGFGLGVMDEREIVVRNKDKKSLRFSQDIDEYKNEIQSITFSPIQQWLLKHLLLNGIQDYARHDLEREGDWWSYPLTENLADYKILAEVSGVSESSCFNFIKVLTQKGYLEKEKYSYRFKRIDEIFKSWLFFHIQEKKREIYLEPIKPIYTLDSWRESVLAKYFSYMRSSNSRIVMSGHMGARGAGLSWSNEKNVIFHALSSESNECKEFLQELQLRVTDKEMSTITLNLNKAIYPTLKGRMDALDNKRKDLGMFADPIQLYLDVQLKGARAVEQGDFIFDKILVKHFERWGWRIY